MPFDFAEAQEALNRSILRADLQPYYGDFINEALVKIQNRRSWTFMKVTETIAVEPGAGYEITPLQSNFKELRREPSINFIADDGGMIPAVTVFEEEEIFRVWAWGGAPMFIWPPRVFLLRGPASPTQLATGQTIQASIGIIEPLIEQFNMAVNMFAYLPLLVNPTDLSPFLIAYPDMVLEMAKVIAFTRVNDSERDKARGQFEIEYKAAASQDSYSEVAGRRLRM
jgi:hypothetical protein